MEEAKAPGAGAGEAKSDAIPDDERALRGQWDAFVERHRHWHTTVLTEPSPFPQPPTHEDGTLADGEEPLPPCGYRLPPISSERHALESITLLQRARNLAQDYPDKPCMTWVDARGKEVVTLTRKQLWDKAGAVARLLTSPSVGLRSGDRVMLTFPLGQAGAAYFPALLGCMRAGIVPVSTCTLRCAALPDCVVSACLLRLCWSALWSVLCHVAGVRVSRVCLLVWDRSRG